MSGSTTKGSYMKKFKLLGVVVFMATHLGVGSFEQVAGHYLFRMAKVGVEQVRPLSD